MQVPKEQIPSKSAIIPYYAVAAFCFVLVSLLCFTASPELIGHYFQPKILAITHLAVFGWATMMIFGASNQLAPVICEHKLHNEKWPVAIIMILIAGTILLVSGFWNFSFTWQTYLGGALLLSAMLLHSFNIYKTARAGKGDIVRDFMITAHLWLIVTGIIGLMLLVNLRYPFLPAEHLHYLKMHASIGMTGWFLQLVVGVSSRLVPMFLLSRNEEKKLLNFSYYAFNIGLVILLLDGMILKLTLGKELCLMLILSGLVSYIMYIRQCYKTAMRKKMDSGMKQTFLALMLMSLPFLLLLLVLFVKEHAAPNIVLAYGVSFFGGFISTIIMGQTFKTLPFIVWMHITKQDALPELLPKDLFHEHWVKWQMVVYLPGFLLFLAGIVLKYLALVYLGTALMIVASAWYFVHVIFIIKKLKEEAV